MVYSTTITPTATGTGVALSDPFQDISADFVHADNAVGHPLGARQIMLVPGSDVAALALDLPQGLRGQNREQVARRQLRDQIGLDPSIAEMRPFQTKTSGENWSRVLVADRVLIENWREHAGAACRAVLPDYLGLPTAPDLWSMATTPDAIAVRLGPDDGFGASVDTSLALLDRALRDADPVPKALLRFGPAHPVIEALFDARNIPVISKVEDAEALNIPPPQILAHGEIHMDLRRDPQMARDILARRVLPWRWPFLFGLIAAGLWGASQLVVIDRIKTETAKITRDTTALVKEHFVTTGPVLDARIQVSQAISQLQAEVSGPITRTDPMQLFNRAATVVAEQGAETRSAVYTEDETLTLIVRVANFAGAEQLAVALTEAGLDVTVVDTRAGEGVDTVRTELRVKQRSEPDK